MKKASFETTTFIKSAIEPENYPNFQQVGKIPEFVVVGRSNVGKSSLLNMLFQRKNLVKTSASPGKTQLINFFLTDQILSCVDLPGYGYAKAPVSIRRQWSSMIETYFQKREQLKLILFLFDIRRTPNKEDLDLVKWLVEQDKAFILVITKTDKLNQSQCHKNREKILKAFNLEGLYYVMTSSSKGRGRKELISLINDAMEQEANEWD